MKNITIIAAVSQNWVIGKDNKIPWHLPEDLKHFKALTVGRTIIMGRKTFESIGKPLPKRRNIIVTRWASDWPKEEESYEVASSLEEAVAMARSTDEAPCVIGGGQIYAEALPMANKMHLTFVKQFIDAEGAVFFPFWTNPEAFFNEWSISETRETEVAVYRTFVRKE